MTIIIRTLILYAIVILSLRIMGKRQLGELQPSELVVAIMISDLAAIPIESENIPLTQGIIPVLTLLAAEIIISLLSLKSRTARKILSGEPSVVIYDGKINESELRRLRMNLSDLLEELRLVSCHNISDVAVAVVETSGKLSVIPKDNARSLTVDDFQKNKPRHDGLPCTLIADGQINRKELMRSGWSEEKLLKEIKKQKIDGVKNVFIASLDAEGNLFVQEKGGENEVKGIF